MAPSRRGTWGASLPIQASFPALRTFKIEMDQLSHSFGGDEAQASEHIQTTSQSDILVVVRWMSRE